MKDYKSRPAQPLTRDFSAYGNTKLNMRKSISQCFSGLHESYSPQNPDIGEIPDPIDSTELLHDTVTPQEKKKGFFARIFRK